MADDVPTGDRAVFAFFEIIALAFAFEGVSSFLNGRPWWVAAAAIALALVFFVSGIKLPWLVRKIGSTPFTLLSGTSALLICSLIGFDYYDRRHMEDFWGVPAPEVKDLEIIQGKSFVNEVVELDGKRFLNCQFVNVSLVFRGKKPFVFEHNHVDAGGHAIQVRIPRGPQFEAADFIIGIFGDSCRSRGLPCPDIALKPLK